VPAISPCTDKLSLSSSIFRSASSFRAKYETRREKPSFRARASAYSAIPERINFANRVTTIPLESRSMLAIAPSGSPSTKVPLTFSLKAPCSGRFHLAGSLPLSISFESYVGFQRVLAFFLVANAAFMIVLGSGF